MAQREIVAVALLFVTLLLGIVAVGSPGWIESPSESSGLFETCRTQTGCTDPERSIYLFLWHINQLYKALQTLFSWGYTKSYSGNVLVNHTKKYMIIAAKNMPQHQKSQSCLGVELAKLNLVLWGQTERVLMQSFIALKQTPASVLCLISF